MGVKKVYWFKDPQSEKLFLFFFVYLPILHLASSVAQVWTSIQNYYQNDIEIKDVGFMILPHPEYENSNFFVDFLIISGGIIGLIRLIYECNWKTLLLDFCMCFKLLYYIRILTITLTIFPNPFKQCVWDMKSLDKELNKVYHPFTLLIWDVFNVLRQHHTTCGDVMYSGHTITSVLGNLCWFITPNRSNVRFLMTSYNIVALLSIISTKFHYSDDVIIGGVMTICVYSLVNCMRILRNEYRKIHSIEKYYNNNSWNIQKEITSLIIHENNVFPHIKSIPNRENSNHTFSIQGIPHIDDEFNSIIEVEYTNDDENHFKWDIIDEDEELQKKRDIQENKRIMEAKYQEQKKKEEIFEKEHPIVCFFLEIYIFFVGPCQPSMGI